jgi:hypothetical protein
MIKMFGASWGSRSGGTGHFMVESCSRGLATPAMGMGGKGRMEPSLGVSAVRQADGTKRQTPKVIVSIINKVFIERMD